MIFSGIRIPYFLIRFQMVTRLTPRRRAISDWFPPVSRSTFTNGYGIFKGEPHAVPKRKDAKHNPLQWLTYLSLAALLLPDQMTTGFVYWGYNPWTDWGLSWLSLEVIALIHTTCAFAILQFLVIHHYMATTALVVIYPFPAFTRSDMISHSNSATAPIIWYHARLRQGASLW